MQRVFRNPGDVSGIPRVQPSSPAPKRDKPLPGTKSMKCPEDPGKLKDILKPGFLDDDGKPKTGDKLGSLAIFTAVVGVFSIWSEPVFPESAPFLDYLGLILWISFALTHILAVFSQILPGHTMRGGWAVLILYVGAVFTLFLT